MFSFHKLKTMDATLLLLDGVHVQSNMALPLSHYVNISRSVSAQPIITNILFHLKSQDMVDWRAIEASWPEGSSAQQQRESKWKLNIC